MAEQNGYAAFVTTDQNLRYQQNLVNRAIAIVVLRSTSWKRIQPHTDRIVATIEATHPGDYVEVPI